jgi:hypothetical protein
MVHVRMSRARRWLVLISVPAAVALAGCGSTSSTSPVATQRPGVIAGMAEQCSGLPGQPTHQIKVIVYRDHRVVAHQATLGSHAYRFSLAPGQYEVTSDQSYVVPANVSLRQGQLVHADLISSCD